jgi:hypothetical protein
VPEEPLVPDEPLVPLLPAVPLVPLVPPLPPLVPVLPLVPDEPLVPALPLVPVRGASPFAGSVSDVSVVVGSLGAFCFSMTVSVVHATSTPPAAKHAAVRNTYPQLVVRPMAGMDRRLSSRDQSKKWGDPRIVVSS